MAIAVAGPFSAGRLATVEVLLSHGAQVNHRGNRGWTPLHYAALWGNVRMAELLLAHRADASAQDERGLTPLYVANRVNQADVVRLLQELGADPAWRVDFRHNTNDYLTSNPGPMVSRVRNPWAEIPNAKLTL